MTKPSNRRTPAPQGSSSKKPAKVVPTLNLPRAKKKLYTERLMELHQSMFEEIKVHSDSALTFERQAGEELADIGSDSFQREMELGMMTSEEKRVQLIRDALERLQAGTYGVCLDCASPIPEGRLEALPYAKLCVGCKAEREEREAQGLATPDDLTE